MLEPVANIKPLVKEESCPPVNCRHRVIAERSVCQQLKKLYERHYGLVDPYNVVVSKLISDLMASVDAYVTGYRLGYGTSLLLYRRCRVLDFRSKGPVRSSVGA